MFMRNVIESNIWDFFVYYEKSTSLINVEANYSFSWLCDGNYRLFIEIL